MGRADPRRAATVAHQIAHLTWTDEVALLAAHRPGVPSPRRSPRHRRHPTASSTSCRERAAAAEAGECRSTRWRDGRDRLQRALRAAPPGTRIPWYGPPMSVASMATVLLMETWAHGQDVADALGAVRVLTSGRATSPGSGCGTRDDAFLVQGIKAPDEEFRHPADSLHGEVILIPARGTPGSVSPDRWHVFRLLVTRRAHRDDLAVRAVGADADQWLGDIAQAFVRPPLARLRARGVVHPGSGAWGGAR